MQRDRLGRGHQGEERTRDRHQLAPQRSLQVDVEQGLGHLFLAAFADRRGKQRLLVAEVTVDRELGHSGLGRDRIHAGAFETMVEEQALGGGKDRGALFQVLGAARTA